MMIQNLFLCKKKTTKFLLRGLKKTFLAVCVTNFMQKMRKKIFVNRPGRQLFVYQSERRIVKFPISHKVTKGIELFEHLEQFFTNSKRDSLESAPRDDNLTNSTANRANVDQETEKRSK